MAKLTDAQVSALSKFLDALDEWDCEENDERAVAIADFIAGGFDLSEYKPDRLRVIQGGLATLREHGG